jgi:thiamine-phosphate pyrophosphorylase
VLTYYITDRKQFDGDASTQRAQLLRTISAASTAGIDFIQLREKDLAIRELEWLAREALRAVRSGGSARLLINHRTDIALAAGLDGVHLTSADLPASEARALAAKAGRREFLVAVSCHSTNELRLAEAHGADFAVLAPIFEKIATASSGIGLNALREAAPRDRKPDMRVEAGDTRTRFAVFALGGITLENAGLCAAAGADGLAGIRLFQRATELPAVVRRVRSL